MNYFAGAYGACIFSKNSKISTHRAYGPVKKFIKKFMTKK
jgi:hypothetical protein